MALAWNAGWGKPLRGSNPLSSALIRKRDGPIRSVPPPPRGVSFGGPPRGAPPRFVLVGFSAVACPSGQRSTPRKRVWVKAHRGFKSHRHRQIRQGPFGDPDVFMDEGIWDFEPPMWFEDKEGDGSHRHRHENWASRMGGVPLHLSQ